MEEFVIRQIISQGPFAILFVWLLIYVMKRNAERENRLHDILDKFSEKYDIIIEKLRGIDDKLRR